MDKRKSFLAWLAMVLAVVLLLSGGISAAATLRRGDVSTTSFYESDAFSQVLTHMTRWLISGDAGGVQLSPYTGSNAHTLYRIVDLDSCGDVVYYYKNYDYQGNTYTNTGFPYESSYNPAVYAESYRFVLKYSGGELAVYLDGADRTSAVRYNYRMMILQMLQDYGMPTDNFTLFFAIEHKDAPASFASLLYTFYSHWERQRIIFIASLCMAFTGVVLLIIAFIFARYRRAFSETLVEALGHIVLEVKLAAGLFLVLLIGGPGVRLDFNYSYDALSIALVALPLAILSVFALWYLLLDLIRHRLDWFRQSICWKLGTRLVRAIRARSRQLPLERRHLRRFWLFLLALAFLLFLASLFLIAAVNSWYLLHRFLWSSALLTCLVGCGVLLWLYLRGFHALLSDMAAIQSVTRQIREGRYAEQLPVLSPQSDLYPLADDLVHLRDGISDAVDARVRSEHMKSELVTNVSHDLKTPLTSIISYARLLDELHLEEPAGGYVKVLCEKSARLQRLTADLFEVSKAQSGSLPVCLTTLDLKFHLEQSLAEMSDRIEASGLTFRVRTPDGPVHIRCDGERLYRVLENLVTNAISYAMPGTRVYLTLFDNDPVILSIQNVSSYEMHFTPAEIEERFVRGDESRTDGGTGLGLAIAKSFTEAVGGRFIVNVDGDVFRVTLSFPRMPAPAEPPPAAPDPITEESENTSL